MESSLRNCVRIGIIIIWIESESNYVFDVVVGWINVIASVGVVGVVAAISNNSAVAEVAATAVVAADDTGTANDSNNGIRDFLKTTMCDFRQTYFHLASPPHPSADSL